MALSGEQRSILDEILRVGSTIRDPAKRRRYTRAAVQTGIVESNLRNLSYGDADSQGWRQERSSIYSNPTNVRASVRRFFSEARQLDRGQPSWQLAADVQRPAAQYRDRYRQVAGKAERLISGAGGTGGGGTGGVVTGRTPERLAFDPGAATAAALQTLGQRAQPSVSAPALPEFAAKAALPSGYAPVESSGAPVRQQGDDLTQALQAVTSQRQQGIPSSTVGGNTYRAGFGGRGGGGRGGGRGKVTVGAGANRAGANLAPVLMRGLNHLSAVAGAPIAVGTGTNHSKMTTTGNVSDHWDGHGADIPLTGNTLTKRGRQALVAFGMSPSQARKAKGGIYNLNWRGHRVQVIFNTTDGGNHWNHLHVGIR